MRYELILTGYYGEYIDTYKFKNKDEVIQYLLTAHEEYEYVVKK